MVFVLSCWIFSTVVESSSRECMVKEKLRTITVRTIPESGLSFRILVVVVLKPKRIMMIVRNIIWETRNVSFIMSHLVCVVFAG